MGQMLPRHKGGHCQWCSVCQHGDWEMLSHGKVALEVSRTPALRGCCRSAWPADPHWCVFPRVRLALCGLQTSTGHAGALHTQTSTEGEGSLSRSARVMGHKFLDAPSCSQLLATCSLKCNDFCVASWKSSLCGLFSSYFSVNPEKKKLER